MKSIAIDLKVNGAKRARTADPLHAMQVLYQLSSGPILENNSYIGQYKDIFFVTAVNPILLYSACVLKSVP